MAETICAAGGALATTTDAVASGCKVGSPRVQQNLALCENEVVRGPHWWPVDVLALVLKEGQVLVVPVAARHLAPAGDGVRRGGERGLSRVCQEGLFLSTYMCMKSAIHPAKFSFSVPPTPTMRSRCAN